MPTLDPRIADTPEPADGLSAQGHAQYAAYDLSAAIGYVGGITEWSEDHRAYLLTRLVEARRHAKIAGWPRLHAIE